jgi:hypothetical protein
MSSRLQREHYLPAMVRFVRDQITDERDSMGFESLYSTIPGERTSNEFLDRAAG